MRHVLIIPTYGFVTQDKTRPGAHGTIARIKVAQSLIQEGEVSPDCIVPFPQNMLPKGAEGEELGNTTLGENVATYVRSLPEFKQAEVLATAISCGTFADTVVSLQQIQAIAGDESVVVHFVSDYSQLGRLWIIWYLGGYSKTHNWKAQFHLVPNFRTWRDICFHEPRSYLKCLLLSLKQRFR